MNETQVGNMNDIPQKYRLSRLFTAVTAFIFYTSYFLVALILEKGSLDWPVLVIGLFLITPIFILLDTLFRSYYGTTIHDNGIGGFDVWGKRNFVQWHAIKKTKYSNYIGLPFIRVFSEDSTAPLWLPLFMQRQDDFEKNVIGLTPKENVLNILFEEKHSNQLKA